MPLASGPEFYSISFRSGRPHDNDDLLDAVTDTSAALAAMTHNAELINGIRSAKFTVVGTTDNVECLGDVCSKLSLDRARLVHDWLVAHGVPSLILNKPIGRGSPMPVGYKSNEDERFMTRSVRVVID